MSISDSTPGESVRKSGSLISFKTSRHFEPETTRIRRYYKGDTSLRNSSIAHKPSDGRRRGLVLFFDIGASKTLQVYPPASASHILMYRGLLCRRFYFAKLISLPRAGNFSYCDRTPLAPAPKRNRLAAPKSCLSSSFVTDLCATRNSS